MNDTENNTSELEGKVNNDDVETGKEENDTDNVNNQEPKEKLLSQSEVDKLVGKARTEGRQAGKQDALKTYEGKKVFDTEDALEEYVNQRINAYKEEQKLVNVKQSIKNEYGLTDVQLARLSGDDEESLRKDADELFGALKKKDAPKFNTGTSNDESDDSEEARVAKALQKATENFRRKY